MSPKKLLKKMLLKTLQQTQNKLFQASSPKQSLKYAIEFQNVKKEIVLMFGENFIKRRLALKKLKEAQEKQKNWKTFKQLKYLTKQKQAIREYCDEVFKAVEPPKKSRKIEKDGLKKLKVKFVLERNQIYDI